MDHVVKLFHPDRGEVREVRASSDSVDALTSRFEADGWAILSRRSEAAPTPWAARLPGQASLDTAWWCRELRTLLLAGMTVVEALETLKAQALGPRREQLHAKLVEMLLEGQSLSSAMQASAAFPPVLIAGVKASERTSTLVAALDDYLRYHELLDGLRRKTVTAAVYPAIVFSLGMIITLFLLVYVIPRFSQMYIDRQSSVGAVTKVLLWLSKLFGQNLGMLAMGAAILALTLAWLWQQGHLHRAGVALIEAVPALHSKVYEFRLAKLFQSLALMVRGGYALAESLEQCAELQLGPGMRARLLTARSDLEQGRRISTALAQAGLTDTVTARLLVVGERTGNFDQILQTIAQRHASNFATFVERATRIVEPAMLLAVSLLVGGVVVMMYMPVFDIANSIR